MTAKGATEMSAADKTPAAPTKGARMSIKQRIVVSNVFMIAAPVLAALLAGGVCLLALWWVFFPGTSLDVVFDGVEDALVAQFGSEIATQFGTSSGRHVGKLIVGICALIVLAAILAACVVANRTSFNLVIRPVEERLAQLETGLAKLADGDLGYRIEATADDEFTRAIDDFNSLAQSSQDAAAAVERRDAERRQLIADISHDLRSPLTAVRGYAEGLRDGIASTPEQQQRYLDLICSKTDQLDRLVEGLFEFSKLDSDGYPVEAEQLGIAEELRAIARAQEEGSEGRLSVGFSTLDEGTCVVADRRLVVRCVENILDNAVKYRTGETAHVNLSVEKRGSTCVAAFADDGPGMAPEDLERIFEPFFRGDASRTRPEDGSGMGLAFVQRAMRLMGGDARARANEGSGLVIELEFPLAERIAPNDAAAPEKTEATHG